jgi:hypothetical protein
MMPAATVIQRKSLAHGHARPGQAAGLHRHPCPVVGYVAAGTIQFQIRGQTASAAASGLNVGFIAQSNTPTVCTAQVRGLGRAAGRKVPPEAGPRADILWLPGPTAAITAPPLSRFRNRARACVSHEVGKHFQPK